MLHIVNGDATVARLAPAALPGELFVWRDILVEGPVAAELDLAALAAWRAPWLERRLGIDAAEYVAAARAHADGLARALAHDEVVLWFEQDLFCVANLCHLAAWLRRAGAGTRVSLVFPAAPLGTMPPQTLAALFATRAPFTEAAVADAAAWWDAYAAPEPIGRIASGRALAFLDVAWRLHLARFPATGTGLGSVEAVALDTVQDTPRPVADVFRAAADDERMRGHGMADTQFFAYLRALAEGASPLVTLTGAATPPLAVSVAITTNGRAVRTGARDRLELQALDWWLGGVRLEGRRAPWRWDATTERVIRGGIL